MRGYFVLSLTGIYGLFTLLQRYRYIQAYQVDLRLQKIEEAFISDNRIGEEVMSRMQSQSHWRKELVVSIPSTFPCTNGSFHFSLLKAYILKLSPSCVLVLSNLLMLAGLSSISQSWMYYVCPILLDIGYFNLTLQPSFFSICFEIG